MKIVLGFLLSFASMQFTKLIYNKVKNKISYLFLKAIKPETIGHNFNFQGEKTEFLRISNLSHISNQKNVKIGKGVYIAHFTYIDGFKLVTIGEGTSINGYTSILTHSAHNAIRLYGADYVKEQGYKMKALITAPVSIGAYTFIGPNSVVMPGSVIGNGCIVSAFSLLKGEYPDFSIIKGNPAKIIGDTRKIDAALLRKYPELQESYYLNATESPQPQQQDPPHSYYASFRKIVHRCSLILFNNIFINQLLILIKKDSFPRNYLHQNNWAIRKYQEDKTLQENIGCSHVGYIQNLVDNAHLTFAKFVTTNIKPGQSALDIGCGTGLFLKDLEDMRLELYGVDLNAAFIEKAKMLVPKANYYRGSFFDNFEEGKKFDLLSCFSVIMYVEPSRIEEFFDKMYNILNTDGFVFIQYIHALSYHDLLYPDITYTKYSPEKIDKIVSRKFSIIKHEHFYYGHKVAKYDLKRYYFPDGNKTRVDSIENSYLLVLQKK